jgi:hypothetical protein
MENLKRRFKIISLLILSSPMLENYSNYLEDMADAIDMEYPKIDELLTSFEDEILNVYETHLKEVCN